MTRKEVVSKIETWEMLANGLFRLSCASVFVKNLRERKEFWIADITIDNGDYKEIYKDCEYRKSLFSLLV